MHDIELYPSGALSSAPGLTSSPSASARAGTRVTRTTRTLRRSSSGEPGHTWHETRDSNITCSYNVGERLAVVCRPGFVIAEGRSSVLCSAAGRWVGDMPRCVSWQ